VAFLSGWVSFLIGFAAPSASAAFGSAKYLLDPAVHHYHRVAQAAELYERVLATFLIVAFAVIHTSGRRQTAHVQGWITALKLLLLVAFTIVGLWAGWPNYANLLDRPPVTFDLLKTMTFSLVYISYAYIGWNAASFLAGEFANALKVLPKAILLGTIGVVILYLAMNVVYALALPAAAIRAIVNDPGNEIGEGAVAKIADLASTRLFGPDWSAWLSVAVGLLLLSSLSAYLLTGPRVIYAMSVAGQFPAVAARLTRRSGTPGVATACQTACTLVFLWVGSLASLVEYASIGLTLFSMLAIGAVFVLRWKRPDLPRPFRVPGYPVTPAVYLLLTGLLTLAAFAQRPRVSAYALGSILVGVPIYYIWQLTRRPAGTG
jgi:APA family basic amino acid/polyamine antiporter